MPTEDGAEIQCKVDVEYEWLPLKCCTCMSLGHNSKTCPTIKKPAQPVKVFVPRPPVENSMEDAIDGVVAPPLTKPPTRVGYSGGGNGRMIRFRLRALTYAALARAAHDTSRCVNVRGLNLRDHQIAVKELIRNNKLLFLGIIETRVAALNIASIQHSIYPDWKCFTDYMTIGNRIWLTWKDSDVGVDILTVSEQFIHCRATNKLVHTQHLVTIVYGINDVINRRSLWRDLCDLSGGIINEAWFVIGDFNAVLDMSEVCGASGDIRQAMEKFQTCIMEMGLITLSM
ncbi:UNVERIFIED_CONTAM: hypothetical protein Sindi_2463600 [Sesamum indicum]